MHISKRYFSNLSYVHAFKKSFIFFLENWGNKTATYILVVISVNYIKMICSLFLFVFVACLIVKLDRREAQCWSIHRFSQKHTKCVALYKQNGLKSSLRLKNMKWSHYGPMIILPKVLHVQYNLRKRLPSLGLEHAVNLQRSIYSSIKNAS